VEFFDDPLARGQFLNVARARALEQQVPVVIAANVGPTAMIDARGVVRRALPSATDGALEVTVRTRRGTTPYARHGQLWLRVLLALSALSSAAAAWRRRAGGAAPELMKPSRRAGPSAPGLLEK
jgi:apolipoprotein N-acyltransferase